MPRRNLFLIHAWDDAATYAAAIDLLKSRDSGLADYSIPPWRGLEGSAREVDDAIRARLAVSSAVIVVNSPGLHRRPWSTREMTHSTMMDKRIVVLQPRDNFHLPIPEALDGHVYRVSSWRGDALGKAVRGEYPRDGRAFDIAEAVDRRELVERITMGVGAVSFVVLMPTLAASARLRADLAAAGVTLHPADELPTVAAFGVGGAIAGGGLAAAYTRDPWMGLLGAVAGGMAGVALGTTVSYHAALHGSRTLRVLSLEQS
jgi:hypothetical protein